MDSYTFAVETEQGHATSDTHHIVCVDTHNIVTVNTTLSRLGFTRVKA
jgi:hypothetical protein